jgi:hypothetical protein
VGALALAACSVLAPALPEDPARELTRVPFFPQTIHQCGPAALATVLTWSGAPTTPEELAPQVYIPQRQGSLALELVAATRRAGRIPYPLQPDPSALLAELRAGTPVLVLQDLGLAWLKRWHYAVVIGFDAERDLLILRSGTERRRLESRERFIDSWERGGRWALVAMPPERLPASATPQDVVRTLENSGNLLPAGTIARAYAAAASRWPSDATLLFAAANQAYGGALLDDAERLYRQLLAAEPHHVAGRNNYANLLIDRGCVAAAVANARAALADLARADGRDGQFNGAVEDTLARAVALERSGTAPAMTAAHCGRGASADPTHRDWSRSHRASPEAGRKTPGGARVPAGPS